MSGHDLEELLKSKKIVRDRALIDALLRNHAVLTNASASDLDKKIAQSNMDKIKNFSSNDPYAKHIDPRTVQPPKLGSRAKKQSPQQKPKEQELDYHQDFSHFNITPEMYESMPKNHREKTHEYHKEILAGKHPEFSDKIKPQAPAATPVVAPTSDPIKIKKSIEKLNSLIKNITEHFHK